MKELTNIQAVQASENLDQLLRGIRSHEEAIQCIRKSVDSNCNDALSEAIQCGSKLMAMRKIVRAGDWANFLKANGILRDPEDESTANNLMSESTIYRYIAFARDPSRVTGANSVRQALGWNHEGKKNGEKPTPFPYYVSALDEIRRVRTKIEDHKDEEFPESNLIEFKQELRLMVLKAFNRNELIQLANEQPIEVWWLRP